jgi:hypothetical protein
MEQRHRRTFHSILPQALVIIQPTTGTIRRSSTNEHDRIHEFKSILIQTSYTWAVDASEYESILSFERASER